MKYYEKINDDIIYFWDFVLETNCFSSKINRNYTFKSVGVCADVSVGGGEVKEKIYTRFHTLKLNHLSLTSTGYLPSFQSNYWHVNISSQKPNRTDMKYEFHLVYNITFST